MCGRFTLTFDDPDELASELEAELLAEHAALYRPRYNVAPADLHWIVHVVDGRLRLVPARWGISIADKPLLINARSETAATKRAFRDSFHTRRCVIPADGFFEWIGPPKARRPVWFHSPARQLLLFAGVFEVSAECPIAEPKLSFTILTTKASEVVAPAHDRMPVILFRDQAHRWLKTSATDLQQDAFVTLIATEVSPRVNSTSHDDPECLAPASAGAGKAGEQMGLL